ncbi:hypothetical protein D3C81_1013260 [compost metagenome]
MPIHENGTVLSLANWLTKAVLGRARKRFQNPKVLSGGTFSGNEEAAFGLPRLQHERRAEIWAEDHGPDRRLFLAIHAPRELRLMRDIGAGDAHLLGGGQLLLAHVARVEARSAVHYTALPCRKSKARGNLPTTTRGSLLGYPDEHWISIGRFPKFQTFNKGFNLQILSHK